MLTQWQAHLDARSITEKESAQGKSISTMCSQSSEYLKPFFRDLKKNQVSGVVVSLIAEICMRMQQREYQMANDAYLRLSIGNGKGQFNFFTTNDKLSDNLSTLANWGNNGRYP